MPNKPGELLPLLLLVVEISFYFKVHKISGLEARFIRII
jgi:hypothetical protein